MSNELKLGQIITDPNAARDAIHIAVVPLTADVLLLPGNRVGLSSGTTDRATTGAMNMVGIVDPFLSEPVKPGQRFWCFLFPGTITSLRHDWAHPAFPTPQYAEAKAALDDRAYSERWLREYATRFNCYLDAEAAFAALVSDLRSGELYARGSDLHGLYDLYDADDLKKHAETYLGIKINWGTFSFTCSC